MARLIAALVLLLAWPVLAQGPLTDKMTRINQMEQDSYLRAQQKMEKCKRENPTQIDACIQAWIGLTATISAAAEDARYQAMAEVYPQSATPPSAWPQPSQNTWQQPRETICRTQRGPGVEGWRTICR